MHRRVFLVCLSVVLFLCLTGRPSLALVLSPSTADGKVSLPFQVPSDPGGEALAHRTRPWHLLRDALIRMIFRLPREAGLHHRESGGEFNRKASELWRSKDLSGRYADDLVLRFRVRNAGEVAALTAAVHVLFLDVWESREEWVDIRLAKELVGCPRSPDRVAQQLTVSCSSFHRCYVSCHPRCNIRTPH